MKKKSNHIVQLVPKFGGISCGVADYSSLVGKSLETNYGKISRFITVEAGLESEELGSRIQQIERSFADLASNLEGQSEVLLHYVGYGFQKRGCPFWLLRGLQSWKRQNPSARLVTMFHELYATGLPWQSSFWTSPLQRWICRELARLSDGIVTSREKSASILRNMTGREDIINLPIFSSMGEPVCHLPLVDREPLLIIFGGKAWRSTALVRDHNEIIKACRKWGIEEVVEIGAGQAPEVDLGIPVRRLGRLSAEEVSKWLNRARLGFISYPSTYLEKSSIFAAYAAHGVVPVLPKRSIKPLTLGVMLNQHFISADSSNKTVAFLEDRGKDIYDWYQGHRNIEHTKNFAKIFGNLS